jgi:hypothetical protein
MMMQSSLKINTTTRKLTQMGMLAAMALITRKKK